MCVHTYVSTYIDIKHTYTHVKYAPLCVMLIQWSRAGAQELAFLGSSLSSPVPGTARFGTPEWSKGLLPFLTDPVTYIWLWTPRDRNLPYSCLDAADTCPDTQHSVWQSRHLINVRISFHSQPLWTQVHLSLLLTWLYFLNRPTIGCSFCLSLCVHSLPSREQIFSSFP